MSYLLRSSERRHIARTVSCNSVAIDDSAPKRRIIMTLDEMSEYKKLYGLMLSYTGSFWIHLTVLIFQGCLAVEEKGDWNIQERIKELKKNEPFMT